MSFNFALTREHVHCLLAAGCFALPPFLRGHGIFPVLFVGFSLTWMT
jgi:hypothetical protein